MQLAKMGLKMKPMFEVKNVPKPRLKERFLARLEKAQKAFRKRRRQALVKIEALKLEEHKDVVGWLVPKAGNLDIQQCELRTGSNYLIPGDAPRLVAEKPNSDNTLKFVAEQGQLFMNGEHGLVPKFHGDEIKVGSHTFIVKVFSSKSFMQWLSAILFASLMGLSLNPNNASAQNAQLSKEKVFALTGSPFSLNFPVKGLTSVNPEQVQAKITVDKQLFPFEVLDVTKPDTENIFLVDNSSLCVHRRMEDTLNLELNNLIKTFSPNSRVSIVEFSRRSDTDNLQEIYRRVHDNVLAKDLMKNAKPIHCQVEARSVNAVDAIMQQKDMILKKKDKNFVRRRLFVITSGNVRPVEGAKELLAESGVELYPVAYSAIALEYVEKVFTDAATPTNPYMFNWWLKAEPLNLPAKLTYDYKFELVDDLPAKMDLSHPYTVEINYKQGDQAYQFFSDVRFSLDKARLLRERIIIGIVSTLLLILLVYALYRIIRYYKTPICAATGKVVSRTWNASLHDLKPLQPILYIEDTDGYMRTHVIKKAKLSIGSSFSSDVRLPSSLIPSDLSISWSGAQTFTLQSQAVDKLVRVNGEVKSGPVNLGHTDVIQLGHIRLHFLFSA